MELSFGKVPEYFGTAKDWVVNFSGSPAGKTLAQNWEPVPREEQDGYDWAEMRCEGLEGRVHIHRPSKGIYPARTATESAVDTLKVFYGARYYFGLNVVCDVAAYATKVYNMAKEESTKITFDPRGLYNTDEGRNFIVNVLGFSYTAGFSFLMPGFMEWANLSDWFDPGFIGVRPSTLIGLGRWCILGYAMYNPYITRVALNSFEKWRHPKVEKPLSMKEFKQLSLFGMLKAFHGGQILPSALLGIQKIGDATEFKIVTPTMVDKKKE